MKDSKIFNRIGNERKFSSFDYLDIVPDERAQESGYLEDGRCVRISLFLLCYLPANRTFR